MVSVKLVRGIQAKWNLLGKPGPEHAIINYGQKPVRLEISLNRSCFILNSNGTNLLRSFQGR